MMHLNALDQQVMLAAVITATTAATPGCCWPLVMLYQRLIFDLCLTKQILLQHGLNSGPKQPSNMHCKSRMGLHRREGTRLATSFALLAARH